MLGRRVGVLSLIAFVAIALSLGGGASGPQTLVHANLPQAMLAQSQTVVVGNGGSSASTEADAQCPKPNSEQKIGYYPDKPRNADFKDHGTTYHNLYGKPCKGKFITAFCSRENFCNGTMAGSQCESNGVWGPCKEQAAGTVRVACSTPEGCAASQIGGAPAAPTTPTTPIQKPGPGSAANTQLPPASSGGSAPAAGGQAAPVTPGGSANSGISAIANGSGGQTTAPVPAGPGVAPVSTAPVAPTGPAFQSPSYVSAPPPPPAGAPVTGAPTTPTTPTSPYGQSTPSTWSPGYNSSRYPGGSSPLSIATNQSGPMLFFNSMFSLFSGLISSGSSDSGGSYSSAPARAPAQKTTVQNVIQLYVVTPTNGTTGLSKPAPASPTGSPGVSAYNITIPETPPVYLNGTVASFPSQGSFPNLFALIESHIPTGEAYGSAPTRSTVSSQDGGVASSAASGPETRPSHVSTLDSALTPTQQSSSTLHMTGPSQIAFVQPYAVSASAPAGANGFSPTLDLIDAYTGGWTGGKIKDPAQSLMANKAALAQVQSNYESAQAALSAWQALASAGLCPESCRETIAALQSQLPNQEKQMQKLSDAVYQGASALSRTPAIDSSIAALARDPQRAAQLLTEGTPYSQNVYYGELFPPELSGNDGTASGTVIRTVARYDLPIENASTSSSGGSLVAGEVQSGKSSTGLPELLAHVWDVLTSWLAPTASSTPSGAGCSLLGSLFGFCKSS